MAKDMKTRKGKDGFHYPYTSPDLAIDATGKSNTKKFEEISSQFKNIAYHFPYVGRMVFKSFYSIITVRGGKRCKM